jgi:CBS domain-containing protein
MPTETAVKVRQIMTLNPICCLPSDNARDVAAILRDRNVGVLPVVKDHRSRKLVGMITDRDLCCAVVASGLEGKAILIRQLFTRKPVTCHLDDELDVCLALMERYRIRRIPVVDDGGRCVGIVSLTDIASRTKLPIVSGVLGELSKGRHQSPAVA